jgi:uncharacterized protein
MAPLRRPLAKGRSSGAIVRLLVVLAVAAVGPAEADHHHSFAVLVFSKTAGYRHASIPDGVAAIKDLGARHGFRVDASEDSAVFGADALSRYRVVIFLNTTGDVLDKSQQTAFEDFIRRGGGFVGIHSASDTEYDWLWYGRLVGAYFHSHPEIQPATLRVVAVHPSTGQLPARWQRTDEWYNFRAAPGPDVTVSLRIDEDSYIGGTMGAHHPMAWHHFYDGGRAWYTALGHTRESYQEPLLLDQILGGIEWAAGIEE